MTGSTLRILHIINSLDPRHGGTVECVRQIGGSIASRGHTVEVAVCDDLPESTWLKTFPLKSYPLGPGLGKYAYTTRLREWLREHGGDYDAWIINGLWQYQGYGASRVATELRIPYFVYPHGMLDPWNRRAHPFKYIKKLMYWLAAERSTLENASGLVFTSAEEAVLAQRYFPSSNWSQIVVGNGIAEPPPVSEAEVAAFREVYRIAPDEKVMLFLSRIHPKKGIDLLLRAFARPSLYSRFVLVIAGTGEEAHVLALKNLARELRVEERVRWVGHLEGQAKWSAFRAADLFVLPSHQENFGIAVAEALAAGTPVCTTTSVNTHTFISQYRAGLVCRDEESDLARALERWQNLGHEEVLEVRRRARRCFEQNFRVDVASGRLLEAILQSTKRGSIEGGALH